MTRSGRRTARPRFPPRSASPSPTSSPTSPGSAIAVIGDGALSAGMAYEAMNNAAAAGNRLIVILNDNDMSIAPPVGACATRSRGWSARANISRRASSRRRSPGRCRTRSTTAARKVEEYTRGWVTGGTLFEELGFYYVGPVDGHDVRALVEVLENVRDAEDRADAGPRRHQEGQGLRARPRMPPTNITAWSSSTSFRASRPRPAAGAPSYTSVFAKALIARDGARRQGRGDHRRDAVGHRARQGRRAIPRAHVRRRHCRAACGDLRRGLAAQGYRPFARFIRPSCSAPTTRSSTTSRSRICRCASRWTAPGWSAPTARPTRAASTSLISARCPISW